MEPIRIIAQRNQGSLSSLYYALTSLSLQLLIKNTILYFQTDKHIGVAIGEWILDLNAISHLFNGPLLKDKQHVFKVQVNNMLIFCLWSKEVCHCAIF